MRISPISNQTFRANQFYKFKPEDDTTDILMSLYNKALIAEKVKRVSKGKVEYHYQLNACVIRTDDGVLYLTGQEHVDFMDKLGMNKDNPDWRSWPTAKMDKLINEFVKKAQIVNSINDLK